jgi:hypothetical protein
MTEKIAITETIATKRREAQIAARKAIKESLNKGTESKEKPLAYAIKETPKTEAIGSSTGEIPTKADTLTPPAVPIQPSDQSTAGPAKQSEESKTGVIQAPEGALEAPVTTSPSEKEKEEQQRTHDKKALFISIYKRTLGSIKSTCEKAEIGRQTFYDWADQDPDFVENIKRAFKEKLEDVEELENKKMLAGEGAMIRHFLDRRHPLYKPKVRFEGPLPGEISGEDDVDDFFGLGDNKNNEPKDKPGLHQPEVQDPGQERRDSPVQTEPGAGVLLETQNKKEPDTKGPAEGHQ